MCNWQRFNAAAAATTTGPHDADLCPRLAR